MQKNDYCISDGLSELALLRRKYQLPALKAVCERGDIAHFGFDKPIIAPVIIR